MPEARRTTQLPSCCRRFFSGEKCSIVCDLAVADDHVGVAGEDRRDQLGDVAAEVLVVGVGVDDHVGAELQAGVEAGLEGRGEALVVGQPDDVVDAVLARDLDRAVGRAVVDHEPLDRVEAVDLARQVGERAGSVSSSFRQGIWMMSFIDEKFSRGGVRGAGAWQFRVISVCSRARRAPTSEEAILSAAHVHRSAESRGYRSGGDRRYRTTLG